MDIVERIARVLAGAHLSRNAEGTDAHAGAAVDAAWPDHRNEAIAVLKALREPTSEMCHAAAIDPKQAADVWQAMVRAVADEV